MYGKDIFSMNTSSRSAGSSNESTNSERLFTTSNKSQCVGVSVSVGGCECVWVRVWMSEWVRTEWVWNEDNIFIHPYPHSHTTPTHHIHTLKFVAFQRKFIIIFDIFFSHHFIFWRPAFRHFPFRYSPIWWLFRRFPARPSGKFPHFESFPDFEICIPDLRLWHLATLLITGELKFF